MSEDLNPCTRCGACCADQCVVFHVAETDEDEDGFVPDALTGLVSDSLRCMQGTQQVPARCVALRGDIGREVFCAIYDFRPSPCRDYEPHGRCGDNAECNAARARHGLAPLPDPHPGAAIR
jgi:Fe-S-cluster containining protein